MTVLERILQLKKERGWTEYRLSLESGIAQTTISSWFRKNITPSIASLQRICDAFGITMSQFFAWDQNAVMDLTPQQRQLLQQWSILTPNQQELLLAFLQTIS